jgi:hypothetical protein
VSECETDEGISSHIRKRKPLGFFLEEYTKGRNLSVYMGYTSDTPVGCDLVISDFIWNTYRAIDNKMVTRSCNLIDNTFDFEDL